MKSFRVETHFEWVNGFFECGIITGKLRQFRNYFSPYSLFPTPFHTLIVDSGEHFAWGPVKLEIVDF